MIAVRSAAELMPLLPELVLVCGAFALLMLDLFLPAGRRVVTHLSSIALLVVVVALIASGVGGHGDVLGGMFVRDTAADVLKISIAGIGALAMVYLWPYLRERGLYQGEVSVLMLFATLGMMLLVSAGSLVIDRKSTRLNSSHVKISYAVFCLKKKNSVSTQPAIIT